MKSIFDTEVLNIISNSKKTEYTSANPYPHIVIDNFLDHSIIEELIHSFPRPTDIEFYKYDNPLEKKLAMDDISRLPKFIGNVLLQFNSSIFLNFLGNITGIKNLIPDPYFRGGGIHQVEKNGKLDIHIDFNLHPKLKLERKLNAILFLNKNWKEEYGGFFEVWRGYRENNMHILESCAKKVLPIANRLVLFNVSDSAYHGHPDPLTCPDNLTRKSLALYYYVVPDAPLVPHSTIFFRRPFDKEDNSLELLRNKRSLGRLNENIKTGNP